jgi:hypothetical protein
MRAVFAAAAVCVAALSVAAGSALADNVRFGVNDDEGMFEKGSGPFWSTLTGLGMHDNTITVRWDETSPTGFENLGNGVTLGLIHGSAPHSYVLCHKAGERFVEGDERFVIPPLADVADLHTRMSLLARRAKVHAIALNTRDLDEAAARRAVEETEAETGLPTDDPVRFGAGKLMDALEPLAGAQSPAPDR